MSSDLQTAKQSQRRIGELLKEISQIKKHLRATGGQSASGAPEQRLNTVQLKLARRRQKRLANDCRAGRTRAEIDPRALPPGTIEADESDTVDLATYR